MGKFKQKLTAFVLSAATFTGIAAAPVSAAMTPLWKENFNNLTDAPGVSQGTSSLVDDYSGGKALKMTAGSGGVAYLDKYIDTVSDGMVELSYSFKPDADAKAQMALMPSTGASATKIFMEMVSGAVYASQEKISGAIQTAQLLRSGLDHNKWYNIEYKINMESKRYETILYNEKGVVLGKAGGSHTFTDLSRIRFLVYAAEGKSVVYDNIKVVHKPLADVELLVDEDFNYYQSVEQSGVGKRAGNATVDLDCGENGTYQALRVTSTGTDDVVLEQNFTNSVPAGKYKVSFQIYAGANTGTNVTLVQDGANMTSILAMTADGTLFAGDTVSGQPVDSYIIATGANLDRWYDAELVMDTVNHTYDITVTAQNGTVYDTKTVAFNANVNTLNRIRYNLGKPTSGAISKFDSVKIERYNEETDKALFRENFNNYKNVSDANFLPGTTGNARLVDDRNGGKALEYTAISTSSSPIVTTEAAGKLESGKYIINFSIKPEIGENTVQFVESGTVLIALQFKEGNIKFQNQSVGTYTAGTWYDVKLDMVLPNGSATLTVTDPTGNAQSTSVSRIAIGTMRGFRFVGYPITNASSEYECKMTVDDITVFKDEQKVVFSASADGAALSQVVPSVQTITVTFAQDMNTSTLNSDNIYIQKKNNPTDKVAYTSSYADKVYTMTLSDFLTDGADYELVVTKDVETADEKKNDDDVKIEFSAKAAQVADYNNVLLNIDFSKKVTDHGFYYDVGSSALVDGTAAFPESADATGGSSVARIGLPVSDEEATKELKLTVKVKPGTGNRQEIRYADSNPSATRNQVYLFSIKDGRVWVGSTNKYEDSFEVSLNETLDTSKWYTIEVVFNRETKKIEFTMMNEDTDVIGSVSKTLTQSFDYYGQLYLISYQDEEFTQCYFDDLKVERVLATPAVKSLEFISADGKTTTDATKVSSITKKINIDFGTVIAKEYVTKDYIKLVKFGTDTKADYFLERNGDVVTLNLSSGLETNSNYELVISKDVATQDGLKIESEKTVKISVGDGAVSATVASMVVNGKAVEHVNDVVNGQTASIEYDYVNSTGKAQTLYTIVAYYIGNRMTYADYITTPVAGNIKATTIKCPHTLGDTDNIDTIKIFAWDGFDTMHPISAGKVIQ